MQTFQLHVGASSVALGAGVRAKVRHSKRLSAAPNASTSLAPTPPQQQLNSAQLLAQPLISLKGMSCGELADWCESVGERRARGMHIWRCVSLRMLRRLHNV